MSTTSDLAAHLNELAADIEKLFRRDDLVWADHLRAAALRLSELERENARMRAELSAAVGYMMNARIDLETGCTKATAIKTISGGIDRARAALAGSGEK
jgi:hypothetical protein